MKRVKISVCYIVKNEEKNLPVSLSSIQEAADEIVVIDTGSADNTKSVARNYGAEIYDYKWQEDFAAARNFALTKLNGDWVVFLDADEYFSEETAKNLRTVIEVQALDVNLLLVQRQDVDESGKVMLSLYVPRIFRLRPELRYVGAIHEELREEGRTVTGIVTVPPRKLQLIHTGYAGDLGMAKAQRNLKMLQQELKRTTTPERLYGYMAEAYDGIEDEKNAMKYAYMDIERGRQSETYASRSYRLLLAKLSVHKKDYQERQRVARLAVQDYPELPEFHAEYAESLAAGWKYAEAAAEMTKAVRCGENYQGIEPTVYDGGMAKQWQHRQEYFMQLAAVAAKIKISACVITKNEECNIGKWLKNAQIYADECIVLDTGSQDATCTLAENGGATVYHYEWQDDFAAAKNQAKSYARGSWLTFLDADETVDKPELVRGMLAEYEILYPQTDVIIMTSINLDADDGYREISRYPNRRIFRNRQGLNYSGRVHENLQYEDGQMPATHYEERLFFHHTGYSTSVVTEKIERNLALLKKEIAEKGEQPEHLRYLADCYYALGDYQQAQLYALRAIDAPLKGQGTHGDMYYMVLKCMASLREPAAEQIAFAQAAQRQFPGLPDFPAVRGMLYQEAGQYEQGEKNLSYAIRLAGQYDGRESSSFADIEALVYAKLADCQRHLGRMPEALQNSSYAVQVNPYEEQSLAIFCDLRRGSGEKLVTDLQHYFNATEQDLSFLCRFSERNGFKDLYVHYSGLLSKHYSKTMPRQEYYELLQTGDWQRMMDKLQNGLTANLEQTFILLLRLANMKGKSYREMERQLMDLLPVEVYRCWREFSQGEMPTDWQIYKTLWGYILSYGDEKQIDDYAELALGQKEIWSGLAADMIQQEKWQSAFNLLAKIPLDEANGSFWQDLGRCLYHLGEYSAAREALHKARQAGCDTWLLKSYEQWLENVG